jgi:hypothetical protein
MEDWGPQINKPSEPARCSEAAAWSRQGFTLLAGQGLPRLCEEMVLPW